MGLFFKEYILADGLKQWQNHLIVFQQVLWSLKEKHSIIIETVMIFIINIDPNLKKTNLLLYIWIFQGKIIFYSNWFLAEYVICIEPFLLLQCIFVKFISNISIMYPVNN